MRRTDISTATSPTRDVSDAPACTCGRRDGHTHGLTTDRSMASCTVYVDIGIMVRHNTSDDEPATCAIIGTCHGVQVYNVVIQCQPHTGVLPRGCGNGWHDVVHILFMTCLYSICQRKCSIG